MYSELETIRGDFQYVKKKQRHLTDSRFHSVPIDLVFYYSALFSQLGLTVKGTCVVVLHSGT